MRGGDMGVRERLIEHCTADAFAKQIDAEVTKHLPEKPTVEQLDRAKLHAQHLYFAYQKANPCLGTFVNHRCVIDVYHEILGRLYAIEPLIVPPPPPPRQRRKQPPPPPRPSAEERAATIVGEIHATAYGLPKS